MSYLILFLIGIIFYFIVTIEYFNVGGQKLITPLFPKESWREDGSEPIYYRISDESCRLGLLYDKYDYPAIKEILEKTKLDTSTQYGKEVGESESRFATNFMWGYGDYISDENLYLPEHNTYVANNVVARLQCTKPGDPRLSYGIKCNLPSIYKINMHGILPPAISQSKLNDLGKPYIPLNDSYGQRTFRIPPNVTIVSYFGVHTLDFTCAGRHDLEPRFFCDRMRDSTKHLTSNPSLRSTEAFGLYTSIDDSAINTPIEDAPHGHYIEVLLSTRVDRNLPNLIKCGNTSQLSNVSLDSNPVEGESGNKNNVTQLDLDVIYNNGPPIFSTNNLRTGLKDWSEPPEEMNKWYLSDMVDKVVAIDEVINGPGKPIEIHLFSCHSMMRGGGSNSPTNTRYYHSDDSDKRIIMRWMSNNRQNPSESNVQYAKDSIKLVEIDSERELEEAELSNVLREIESNCNKCTFPEQEGVDKSRCPDGHVTNEYMDTSTDDNEKLLGYNAVKVIEPTCKLRCNPGYTQSLSSMFRDFTEGECKKNNNNNKFEGNTRLGSVFQARPSDVNITCVRQNNRLSGRNPATVNIDNPMLDAIIDPNNPSIDPSLDPWLGGIALVNTPRCA